MDQTFVEKSIEHQSARLGGWLSVAASLMWLPQAYVIAALLSDLLLGEPAHPMTSAMLFMGLSAIRALLSSMAQKMLSAAAAAQIGALQSELIAREAQSAGASSVSGAGAIAALSTEKLEALRPYLTRYRPARLRGMVLPFVILAIAASQSWAAAVILIVAGPLIPLFMALVGWAAKEASERQMAQIGSLSDILADRLAALSDLRLIGAGPNAIAGFAAQSEALRASTMAVLRIAFLSSTVLELFSALGVAMMAVWVGFALLGELGWGTWGAPLTPLAGIFLLLLTPDFFQPLRDLAAAWHDKAAADAVLGEMAAWRAEPRRALMGEGGGAEPMAFAQLSTRGLCAARGAETFELPDITVRFGESVALTGPSGAGKTTLLRLLAGLDAPLHGEVTIDRRILDGARADAWRSALGWMPQTPRFLGRSLGYNVGLGAPLDAGLVTQAALGPVLSALPRGRFTRLGESGAGLSGGEARRVMLARTLHRRPKLILADEPTADLDADTAQTIVDALLAYVASGGTLIAATHDPRLAARLDRQIKLEGRT